MNENTSADTQPCAILYSWGQILQTSEGKKEMVHIQNVRKNNGFKVINITLLANTVKKYFENIFTENDRYNISVLHKSYINYIMVQIKYVDAK